MDILIAEETATVRRMLRNALEQASLSEFMEVQSAADAMTFIQRFHPKVVITGAQLGDATGFELTTQIRHVEDCKEMPIILVTPNSTDEDVLEAMDCGVDDYLIIPFAEDLLADKVRKALERAALLEEQKRRKSKTYVRRAYLGR